MAPHTIILEPITECVLLGLLASLAASVMTNVDCLAFFLYHLLAWALADWALLNILQVNRIQHFRCNSMMKK